ncbi:uncharacterized protein [Euphorbia lathyris]|uniref:uncharacterized protein n=1 Tax=Euphorbia lathyris TaxID=212925 RepID=UPI00331393A3
MTGDFECDLSSQDSHPYLNSEFFDEIDALVERIKREKKDQRESETPMKKSEEKYSCPNFNLLSQELHDFVGAEGGSTQIKNFVEKVDVADVKNNSDPEVMFVVDDEVDNVMIEDVVDVDLQALPRNIPDKLQSLCKWANSELVKGNFVSYVIGEELFGHAAKALLLRHDIYSLVHMEEITCNVIIFYMSYLFNLLKKRGMDKLFYFVDPHYTYSIGSTKTVSQRSYELMNRLKMSTMDKSIFLCPYNTGGHWTLSVIDLTNFRAYWLDPLRRRLPKADIWMDVVNDAILLYSGNDQIKVKWTALLGVPEQKDHKTCGFFVMRYMRDIVMDNDLKFAENWKSRCGMKYSQIDLDEVRKEFVEEVVRVGVTGLDDCFTDDVSNSNAMRVEKDVVEKAQEGGVGNHAKRISKLHVYLQSPFLVESEHLLNNMLGSRRMLVEYAFCNGDPHELLYSDSLSTINREEIMTLSGKNHLVCNVVDAWSRILNGERKSRGQIAANRLFFSTVPFVFFPVVHAAHFYLFVINHFTGKIDVIDNKALEKGVQPSSKYKGFAKALVKAYSLYIKRESPECLNDISAYSARHLKLKWKDTTNNDDCGVFLMKHIELYFGQDVDKWDIGFGDNNIDPLKNFRVEYCWRILPDPGNKEVVAVNGKALKWKNEH